MSYAPSYKLNRKCLYCDKPIADHVDLKRKFCPRVVLPNGIKVNCKDRYNSRRAKPINEPFKFMAKWHKYYYYRIKAMVEKEGTKVTLEIINRYGINLYRPFEFIKLKEDKFSFRYHHYAIEELGNNYYKIIEHGLF